MRGNVIGFDPDTNTGAISGHDGQRYEFATQDWHGHSTPHRGDLVDFTHDGQRATQIFLLEPEYVRPGFFAFYLSPAGRISRSQYWLRFALPVFIISLLLDVVAFFGSHGLRIWPKIVFQLVVLWPGIAILIKRIHDRAKSGWLVWLLYVPLILGVIFLIGTFAAALVGASSFWGLRDIAVVLCLIAGIVGIWFFIEFGCMRGTIGANRYGPDPVPRR